MKIWCIFFFLLITQVVQSQNTEPKYRDKNFFPLDTTDENIFLTTDFIRIEKPISTIPEIIFRFQQLSGISFSIKNKVYAQKIFIELQKIKKLEILEISGYNYNSFLAPCESDTCGLTEIPIEINAFVHLRKIDFNGHFIKEINLDPEKLVNLESVLLFRNKIEIFPSKLLKFNSLRQIGLENNYIREIPKEICDSKINDLSIGRNYLTEMPECLFKKDLEYLFVNENMISDEKIKIYESLKNKKTVTIFDNQRKDFFKK